ncbi:hypothetical protein THRCLA_21596 [Thraustotheca clavata]|uniref:Uncharacterized protein n=1 Tax=Thraustotheca clavata TaxID=74557 RepID=A0A1V9ZV02_9STRA|nr:hypothetical protein THRCLA_21596 [Thraustotheca clavata]
MERAIALKDNLKCMQVGVGKNSLSICLVFSWTNSASVYSTLHFIWVYRCNILQDEEKSLLYIQNLHNITLDYCKSLHTYHTKSNHKIRASDFQGLINRHCFTNTKVDNIFKKEGIIYFAGASSMTSKHGGSSAIVMEKKTRKEYNLRLIIFRLNQQTIKQNMMVSLMLYNWQNHQNLLI